MTTGTAVSVEEYLRTSYDPNCEYVDGALVQKPMPTWRHSRVQGRIFARIDSNVPGYMVGTESTVQVSGSRFLVPDLAVQDASAVQEPYPTKPIVLCIEILSPDDSLNKTLAKCDLYHQWGTVNTWIVDPENHRAWQYTRGNPPQEIDPTGKLEAGSIHIPIADIFRGV
jgi:Uma2 family endonuclease